VPFLQVINNQFPASFFYLKATLKTEQISPFSIQVKEQVPMEYRHHQRMAEPLQPCR
jgi:hypothetical protein